MSEWYYLVPIFAISATYCVVKSIAQIQQSRCSRLSTVCCTVERSLDDTEATVIDVTPPPVALRDVDKILRYDDEHSTTDSDVGSTASDGRVQRMTELFETVQ